jgi:hypothetical protein
MLDAPLERPVRIEHALDEGVRFRRSGNQTQVARSVFTDQFSTEQRLAEHTEVEPPGLGLAQDDITAAKRRRITGRKRPTRVIKHEYAVYAPRLAGDGGHHELLDEFATDLFPDLVKDGIFGGRAAPRLFFFWHSLITAASGDIPDLAFVKITSQRSRAGRPGDPRVKLVIIR